MTLSERKARLSHVRTALRYWDPIGVIDDKKNGSSIGDDEYDSYANNLLLAVEAGDDSSKLSRYLAFARSVSMGLGDRTPTERECDLAEKLVHWRESDFKEVPDFRFDRYAT